jgi:hypothetical protein
MGIKIRFFLIATVSLVLLASGSAMAQEDEQFVSNPDAPTPQIAEGIAGPITGNLFVGTSLNPTGGNHDVFLIDPDTDTATPVISANVWGATVDFANQRVLFTSSAGSSNGDMLYSVPLSGGTPTLLGQIMDVAGGPQRIDGLAMSNGILYGSYAGGTLEDGLWQIDPDTQVATLIAPFSDSISGIDADPATGTIYGANDTTLELVTIATDGTITPVAAYPGGFADIDGLAVGGGVAYLVTDEPGTFPVYDLVNDVYVDPLTSPFTLSETFSGGAIAVGGTPGRSTFLVSKDFNDNNPAEVEVTLSCNTGLPLEQTTEISEGDPVNFVIVDFEDGTLDCEVTEVIPAGYSVQYDNGTTLSAESCAYEDIDGAVDGTRNCTITNSLNEVEVEVTKVWIDENPQFAAQNVADATWSCSNVAFGQNNGFLQFFGNPGEDSFFVFPDWEFGTTCSITEVGLNESGVEVDDSDCDGLVVLPGEGASCTIFNTRLFEGIPTLSQYGLAVLALLMLGVGFVAYRRLI